MAVFGATQEFELDVRNFLEYKPRVQTTEAAVKVKQEAERATGEATDTLNGAANGVDHAAGSDEDVKVEGQ